jgi:hypothetical protein
VTKPVFLPLKMSGLNLDLAPEDVAPDRWTSGRNVYFRNSEVRRVEGINQIFPGQLFAVEIAWYVDTGQQEWWLYASGAGVGVTDGAGNHYNITPVGWTTIVRKNFVLSAGDLNTLPFLNHPELGPYWWDANPLAKMQKLPGWPAGWSCYWMASHKNFLLAFNIDTGGGLAESQVSWSVSADPGQVPDTWAPSPTNDAGDITFATPGGPLIGAISLRDQLFVMKANATYAMQYVGGQWVFQGRDVFPSMGLYGPLSVIERNNMVYMLTGRGGLVRHDGSAVENILTALAQDYLSRTMNAEWNAAPFMYRTDLGQVIGLAYPVGTGRACTEALGIDVSTIGRDGGPDVGLRDLPGVYGAGIGYTEIETQTWNGAVGSWDTDTLRWNEQASGYRPPQVVFAGGSAGMLRLGKGDDVLGVPITAYAERLALDVGEFGAHKVVSGAFPRVRGNQGDVLYFRFGGQQQVSGAAVDWGTEISFLIGTDTQLDFFQDGRFLAHSVRSVGGRPWSYNGIQLLTRKGSRW